MGESANVTFEALQRLREALCSFQEDGQDGLGAVAMEVQRTYDWLDEQMKHWQREVRRREEEVVQAKAELAQRKLNRLFGQEPDCTLQEKALRKAQLRLQEAEDKVVTVRRWGPLLERAVEDYTGPARQLAAYLEGDVPRACALIDRKLDALEAYVRLAPSPRSTVAQPAVGQGNERAAPNPPERPAP